MAASSTDIQLDAIALIEAHLNADDEAVSAVLAGADLPEVTSLLGWLLANMLRRMAAEGGVPPMSLIKGVDELRASVLEGGD